MAPTMARITAAAPANNRDFTNCSWGILIH
jgi:hypothetical protein